MAERSVFVSKTTYPYYEEYVVQMDWFPGFALSQKRKCQASLHENFLALHPEEKILEVSGASPHALGVNLSAMSLSKETSIGTTCVESAFQSSKVYHTPTGTTIGPFPEHIMLPGKACKKLIKQLAQGSTLDHYYYEGILFPIPDSHVSFFYDYIYLNALLEEANRPVTKELLSSGYTAFTDLATKSLNSQAKSCAIFLGLWNSGKLEDVKKTDTYWKLFQLE